MPTTPHLRPVKDAELYAACARDFHDHCPAGQPNRVPGNGRCDCSCHHPLPPV